jgi:hypothetical protein
MASGRHQPSTVFAWPCTAAALRLPVSSHSYRWLKKHGLAVQHSTWHEQGFIAWLLHTPVLAFIRKCQYLH